MPPFHCRVRKLGVIPVAQHQILTLIDTTLIVLQLCWSTHPPFALASIGASGVA
jgi:hypothetical protein